MVAVQRALAPHNDFMPRNLFGPEINSLRKVVGIRVRVSC